MFSSTNLNEILPAVLEKGSLQDLQKLLACNLNAETLITALENCDQLDFLSQLVPLAKAFASDKLAVLIAKTIFEEKKEKALLLLPAIEEEDLYSLAFECGRLGVTPAMMNGYPRDYTKIDDYFIGLASVA